MSPAATLDAVCHTMPRPYHGPAFARRSRRRSAAATSPGCPARPAAAARLDGPAARRCRCVLNLVFHNDDTAPHTVTSPDGRIDSGVLTPGRSFSLVVSAGFTYKCSIHPFMTASVVVST